MSIGTIKNNFDNDLFNKDFGTYVSQKRKQTKEEDDDRLIKMNTEIYNKKISDMSLNELLVGWKQTIVTIIDDMINKKISKESITKENNLFYIGVTIIICTIIIYVVCLLLENNDDHKVPQEINHNYKIELNLTKNNKLLKNLLKK